MDRLLFEARCSVGGGKQEVNSWWWVPIGLAAWFLVSLAVGLCLGPILRRCSEARDALERQFVNPGVHHERQAS
jgi:hypothetical protein